MKEQAADRMKCGRCGRDLERMVVMQCEHHICLECASKSFSLRRASNQASYRIRCDVCLETTMIEESAAQCLLGQLDDLTGHSARLTKASRNKSAASPGLNQMIHRDMLYCKDCQEPLGGVDEYLRSTHRNHDVQNIKNVEALAPVVTGTFQGQQEIKERLEEQLETLTSKHREKESMLGFLAEKKQIERSRVQMTFDKLRKNVEERELAAYRQLEHLFGEEAGCLQKWLSTATEEIFRLDLKLHELSEVMKEKSVDSLFLLIKDKASLLSANQTVQNLQQEEERINTFSKQLQSAVANFTNFIRTVDKYREALPSYSPLATPVNLQEVTIRDLNTSTLTPEKKTARESAPQPAVSFLLHSTGAVTSPKVLHKAPPSLLFQTESKNTRSNSSLGPSLLKLDKSTPIDNLIKNLEMKISKKSERLNLCSPRALRPVDRIKRLFSPC